MKNGKNKARIEIAIYSNDKGDTVTFHRAFDKESKETLSIEGEKVKKKEYLRRIKVFNIQVDNLCMFLPQDRVQDFTKMNPQELLHNTQASVCSPEINNAFNKLVETRNKQKNNSTIRDDLQTRLEDNRNRNEQLRAIIESNTLRNNLIEKVELFSKKKGWLEYDKSNDEFKVVDGDMKLLTDKIKKRSNELQKLRNKQQEIAGTKSEIKNAISKAGTVINNAIAQMDKLQDAAEKTESDVVQSKQEMKNLIASCHDHKKQVNEKQLMINLERSELQKAQAALANDGNAEAKIQQFDTALKQHKMTTEKLMRQRNGITQSLEETILPSLRNCKRKLETFANTHHQRIEYLRNNHEDVFQAYTWLQANRQNFQGRIFNPVMVEMTVRNKESAKYIENTIAMKDLVSFICTNKEDMKQLIKKFRNEMGLRVNLAFSEDTDEVEFQPSCDIQDFPPNLGLHSYMIDMFDAPAPVTNYLCRLFRVHKVVVGDDRTFENAGKLPREIQLFFSTNHRFAVNISRYSNAKSTSSSMIEGRNILFVGVDTRLKEREEKNLEKWGRDAQEKMNAKAAIEAEIGRIEQEVTEIRNEKNQIQREGQRIQMSIEKLRKNEAEFEKFKNRKINVEEESQKFKYKVDELTEKLLAINERRVQLLLEIKNNHIQRINSQKKLQVFEASTGNVDEEIRKLQNEIEGTTSLMERVKGKHEEAHRRLKAIEAAALQLTDGLPPSDRKFKYKNKFKELPNTLEELVEIIEEMQGRIDCIRGIDPRIPAEFEQRKEEIEQMEEQLANERNRLEQMEHELNDLHNIWHPAIQGIIQTINQNFSNFFNKMGFVGEVEMIHKEEVSEDTRRVKDFH